MLDGKRVKRPQFIRIAPNAWICKTFICNYTLHQHPQESMDKPFELRYRNMKRFHKTFVDAENAAFNYQKYLINSCLEDTNTDIEL